MTNKEYRTMRLGSFLTVLFFVLTVHAGDPVTAKEYYARGVGYQKEGKLDLAIADYDKAVELDPEYMQTYSNRGAALAKQGMTEKALADFEKAIQLNPKSPNPYYLRSLVYLDQKKTEQAISDLTKVLELFPKSDDAYYKRGIAYGIEGKNNKALLDLDNAIELRGLKNPKCAEVFTARGVVLLADKSLDKAVEDFEYALRLDPKYEPAEKCLRMVKKQLAEK